MSKIEMIAQHGWGFSAHIWDAWKKAFTGMFLAPDRGYFSFKKQFVSFQDLSSFKIIITHSLGLHFLSENILSQADLLMILSSFEYFHSTDIKFSKTKISQMTQKLKHSPTYVLYKFYKNCFYPISKIPPIPTTCQTKLLYEDLLFLNSTRLNYKKIEKIPNILILHGTKDFIVPIEKGYELHKNLKNSYFWEIEKAGHALPFTHANICMEKIRKFFPPLFKSKVKKNFSSHIETYIQMGTIQKKAAQELAPMINEITNLPPGPILEIGGGTGHISKVLLKKFPTRKLIISDICPKMVDFCKSTLPHNKKYISFKVLDGEEINEKNTFSLIASGLTFHWFLNLEKAILKLVLALKKGGVLLFSYLDSESFSEWQELCKETKIPFTGNILPSIRTIQSLLSSIDPKSKVKRRTYIGTYPTAQAFFRNLKMTGTSTSISGATLTHHQWKKLLQAWRKKYPQNTKITYKIGLAKIKRNEPFSF